jgi:DNA gyrase subunit A
MGKYHPHGNLAVYDALVRLAQPWSHARAAGRSGRETLARSMAILPQPIATPKRKLTRVSTALLEDLDKETVDFRPNYDGSEVEPDVLPTRIPNLLVNGSDGIAVGMATKIPPHNLTEIVDATITLVNNPNAQLPEILKFVQGPDFPPRHHSRTRRNFRSLPHRPRPLHDARQSRHREHFQRSSGNHRHRDSVSGKQVAPDRAHRATRQRQRHRRHFRHIRDESDRDGMRIVSNSSAAPSRRSCSTSSSSTPPCRKVFP